LEPWHTDESRYIVEDRWLHLRADTCRTASGAVADPYYVIESSDWVVVVALTNKHEVLFVRQYRHGMAKVVLELPCGIQEAEDASSDGAVRRELLEETGYAAPHLIHLGSHDVNPARFNNRMHSYLALDVTPERMPRPDHTEELQIERRPISETFMGLNRGILDLQPMHLVALYRAQAWLQENQPDVLASRAEPPTPRER
jgi:8-oxo-dGTP pyrophosphatase MutT (NUDIX family)